MSRHCRSVVVLLVGWLMVADLPVLAIERNAGKYGAMFSWWYDRLPEATKYPPTVQWSAADPRWWASMVTQAREAGLGWLAAASWGASSTADPAALGPLVTAIRQYAPNLKVALFDDTTSEVLRKNQATGRGWSLDPKFDLSDLDGTGEGGAAYFYEQQWKRFFDTVPAEHRLSIDGRPVVFMWHGGYVWYSHTNFFHALLDRLRANTMRDFGVDPFVIVEESWLVLDPATRPDAIYDWFDAPTTFSTSMTFNGVRIGHVVPGYDCSACAPTGGVIGRQGGVLYRVGLYAVAPEADLVLIEGLTNVDENAHLIETAAWGKRYLDITKWFSSNLP